jgi:hypothetical protein
MATSQNGWPASGDRRAIGVQVFEVDGVSFPGGVRAGDVATVLGHVMTRFHNEVEPLKAGWCWGWAYRAVRAGSSLSNHASGTAVDANAPRHPLGVSGTFTPKQRDRIRDILQSVNGTVRWGGNYAGRKDEMHFEINAGVHAVAVVAARLRAAARPPIEEDEEDDMSNVLLVHGDSTQQVPGKDYDYGDLVFMVAFSPQYPDGWARRYMASGPAFSRAMQKLGPPVQWTQAQVDAIPFVAGGEPPAEVMGS